jgi:hypothetical protein
MGCVLGHSSDSPLYLGLPKLVSGGTSFLQSPQSVACFAPAAPPPLPPPFAPLAGRSAGAQRQKLGSGQAALLNFCALTSVCAHRVVPIAGAAGQCRLRSAQRRGSAPYSLEPVDSFSLVHPTGVVLHRPQGDDQFSRGGRARTLHARAGRARGAGFLNAPYARAY